MKVETTFDMEHLKAALHEYQRATKKEIPDILNRAGRNAAYRSAQFTEKTAASKIRGELKANHKLLAKLTSNYLKRKGIKVSGKGEFAKRMDSFMRARIAKIGYVRVGWANAVEAFGGTFRGRKAARPPGGAGKKASDFRLVAELVYGLTTDTPAGADEMAANALNKAFTAVADDMLSYARNKLQKVALRHST